MRYYDISSRVAAFSVLKPQVITHNSTVIYSAGSDQSAAAQNVKAIDRTGFYSYMAHLTIYTSLTAVSKFMEIVGFKMQSSDTIATAAAFTADATDMTSVTTTADNYKQIYLNHTGTTPTASSGTTSYEVPLPGGQGASTMVLATAAAAQTPTTGNFVDQPYTWTAPGTPAAAIVIDARIFGSLRHKNITGKYIAPWVTVTDGQTSTDVSSISMELILGAGDTMPVVTGGTAGTSNYYSKGQ